jgi:hypothetical protein
MCGASPPPVILTAVYCKCTFICENIFIMPPYKKVIYLYVRILSSYDFILNNLLFTRFKGTNCHITVEGLVCSAAGKFRAVKVPASQHVAQAVVNNFQ